MSPAARQIADNLARVRERIAAAEVRAGRPAGCVKLVAVTKYVGPAEAEALLAAGCHDLGESRPQELCRKAEALAGAAVRWHLVGHWQRNKIRRTLPHVSLLHSGDSLRLLVELDKESFNRTAVGGRASTRLPVLLEVHISADKSKGGFAPRELETLGPQLAALGNVQIGGLMAMASLQGGRDQARTDFANLRALRDRLRASFPKEIALDELSMGMSDDFEIAIEEGATIVRVGSALFEGLT